MSSGKNTTEIKILDSSYLVACSPEEEANLHLAASKLTEKMQKLKKGDKPVSLDKLAVIAALNLANDLVELEQATAISASKINNINNRFDLVLAELGGLLESQK